MSDGANGCPDNPWNAEERVDKYHDAHYEQVKVVARPFLREGGEEGRRGGEGRGREEGRKGGRRERKGEGGEGRREGKREGARGGGEEGRGGRWRERREMEWEEGK